MKYQSCKSKLFGIISSVGQHFRISLGKPHILRRCLGKCKLHKAKCEVKANLKQLLNLIRAQIQISPHHKAFLKTLSDLIPPVINPKVKFDPLKMERPVIPRNLVSLYERKDVELLFKYCDFPQPVPFWFACPQLFASSTRKFAEGGWGEIYRFKDCDNVPRVLKIMPVGKTNPEDQRESQLKFSDILPEILGLSVLCKLQKGRRHRCPNFPMVYKIFCVQDRYPGKLIRTWKRFRESKVTEIAHASPDSYPDDQAFITVEMEMGGIPLSSLKVIVDTMWACSVFIQTAMAVSVAEAAFQFEHRDLHAGNLLVKPCSEAFLDYKLDGVTHRVITNGVKVHIIDFTYSRLKTEQGVMYLDLNDHVSDHPNSSKLYLDNKYIYSVMAKSTGRNWSEFCPFTNNQWLKHLVLTLLQKLRKNMQSFENLLRDPKQREAYDLLTYFNRQCLSFISASSFVHETVINNTKNSFIT